MIKSIFFRALTLLGLTFVLIGCGAADPGEGGTGTPGAAGPTGVSMEDVTKEVEKLIRDSKGKLDTTDGVAVATKFVSIMKASQPMGSCSLFNQGIFPGYGATTAAGKLTYVANGSAYPGGEGKLTVELNKTGAAGIITADDKMVYTYAKYSIDGIYFLDGTINMKLTTATTAASWGASDFATVVDGTELKLYEGGIGGAPAKDIATMKFTDAFKPEFKAGAGATVICGSFTGLLTQAVQDDVITITAVKPTNFTETKMGIKTVGSVTLGAPEGSNVPLFLALIGPRRS